MVLTFDLSICRQIRGQALIVRGVFCTQIKVVPRFKRPYMDVFLFGGVT